MLVGGTMLYFNAFKHGLADLPPTAPDVREALAVRARVEGLVALHEELRRIDPVAAERIHPNNPQRLLRALEVYTTSGRPISLFWEEQRQGGVAAALKCRLVEYAIEPPRAAIHARIETRFERMLDAGLLDEVRGLMARGDLSLQTPSMRAVGYRQVWQHLCGDVDYAAMITNAVAATRQLAKRQLTWLRSWTGKSVLNDPAEAGAVDAMLQSLGAERIVRRSQNKTLATRSHSGNTHQVVIEGRTSGRRSARAAQENVMSKGHSLQDPYLNTLRKERLPVSIYLVNGIKLHGQIESFDQFVILLRNSVSQMVYKHAVSTVVPARNIRLPSASSEEEEEDAQEDA